MSDYQTTVHTDEFKGHEMLVIEKGRARVQFGLTKARLILECHEAIKEWVSEQEKKSIR